MTSNEMPYNSQHCFLIATHNNDGHISDMYKKIKEAASGIGMTYILFHQSHRKIEKFPDNVPVHSFTDEILTELEFSPIFEKIIPGSNHFSLVDFYRKYSYFQYYWYIEYDVFFTGDWQLLFSSFSGKTTDFISSDVSLFSESSSWPWWSSLSHPHLKIDKTNLIRSFNPIYRISARGLQFIDSMLKDQWTGHHEVLMPTLLHANGYSLGDFGGSGPFVEKCFVNKFYTSETFRWRPIFFQPGPLENMLYHPVKIFKLQ